MSSGRAIAALAVLCALLTGCGPKPPKAVASPVVEAPSLPPSRMESTLSPVPPPTSVTNRLVKLDATDAATPPKPKTAVATTEPQHPAKHKPKSADTLTEPKPSPTATPSVPQTTQVANAQPSDMTSIGQLSASDNMNVADRNAISTQIDATENGLNAIKRSLSTDEQKTATLIRSYITRARDALKVDDLDGATTLSNKAHQLLGELTKPQ